MVPESSDRKPGSGDGLHLRAIASERHPYGGEAGEISARISSGFESVDTSDPGYETIAADTASVEEATGLIPEVSSVFPTMVAAGTAFLVGWEIGEGINAIFADVGLGEGAAPKFETEPTACYSKACGGALEYEKYKHEVYFGAYIEQPSGVYRFRGELDGNQPGKVDWSLSPCKFSGFPVPPRARIAYETTTAGCGGLGGPQIRTWPYELPSDLLGLQTFHTYNALIDGTPTKHSKAPANPGTSTVESKAEEFFNSDEEAQSWIDYETDPQDFPNPFITKTRENHDCDRSPGPTYENPEGNESPEPFAKKEEVPFTVTTTPEGIEPESVYLRWGETDWLPSRETFEGEALLDLWGGWGYRHILAKHGWTTLDREETEDALINDITPEYNATNDTYLYEALDPTSGLEGATCERVVVVAFEKGEKEGKPDPAPRGIVTSFNKVVP